MQNKILFPMEDIEEFQRKVGNLPFSKELKEHMSLFIASVAVCSLAAFLAAPAAMAFAASAAVISGGLSALGMFNHREDSARITAALKTGELSDYPARLRAVG
jgi:hypothetical protein